MARVTVEDCIVRIPNRFDLVMTAAQRSREVSAGGQITVERDNDKNPVVALREIAELTIDVEVVQESLIRGLQKHVEIDEPEDDGLDAALGEGLAIEAGALEGQQQGVEKQVFGETTAEELGMQIEFGGGPGVFQDNIDAAVLDSEK